MKLFTMVVSTLIILLINTNSYSMIPESTIKPNRIIHIETDWVTTNRSDVLVLCIDKQEFVIRDNIIIQVFTFDEKDHITKPKTCKSNT